MAEKQCEQCGRKFQAKRRSAKFCSALCRQHNFRGKRPFGYIPPYLLPDNPGPPRITPQASPTFWERMQDALDGARLVAGSTPGAIVAAGIIVMDDDAETVREWELD